MAVCGGNSGQKIVPWSCRALSSPRDRRLNHRRHHQSSALILTLEGMMAVTRQLTDEHDYRRNVVSCSRDKACHAAFIGFGWNLCNGDQSGCCGSQTRVPFHLGNTPLGDGGSTLNKPSTNYCHFSRSSAHLKPPYQPGLMQRVKRFWRIFGPTKNMDA